VVVAIAAIVHGYMGWVGLKAHERAVDRQIQINREAYFKSKRESCDDLGQLLKSTTMPHEHVIPEPRSDKAIVRGEGIWEPNKR
jgi:hypothetical protein